MSRRPPPRVRTFRCPAKVNLALSVGAPREDGYHPICSWMARVSLFDDLTVRRAEPADDSEFDIDWAYDAPQPSAIDWPAEKDLTCAAHRLLEQYAERRLPVAVTVAKRIPVGAGLGGGSSDGAMMLQAMNEMFALGLPDEALREMATHLGSDLAFFFGPSSAIVSGVGERVEPAPLERPLHLALILPDLHCGTARVYRRFDARGAMDGEKGVDEAAVRALPRSLTPEMPLFNDLAEAACRVEPRLARRRSRCAQLIGRAVHITGSGAAMFALAEGPEDARRLADALTTAVGVPTVAVATVG